MGAALFPVMHSGCFLIRSDKKGNPPANPRDFNYALSSQPGATIISRSAGSMPYASPMHGYGPSVSSSQKIKRQPRIKGEWTGPLSFSINDSNARLIGCLRDFFIVVRVESVDTSIRYTIDDSVQAGFDCFDKLAFFLLAKGVGLAPHFK